MRGRKKNKIYLCFIYIFYLFYKAKYWRGYHPIDEWPKTFVSGDCSQQPAGVIHGECRFTAPWLADDVDVVSLEVCFLLLFSSDACSIVLSCVICVVLCVVYMLCICCVLVLCFVVASS
jgi:hypothetical protein